MAIFNPALGLICVESWWHLGRIYSTLDENNQLPESTLLEWQEWARSRALEYQEGYIFGDALRSFAKTVFAMLERKFHEQPIANDAEPLIQPIANLIIKHETNFHYLNFYEPRDSFWAFEYLALFRALQTPVKPGANDWMNAVAACLECGRFFIKTGIDQAFDKEACSDRYSKQELPSSGDRSARRVPSSH